jgi:SNF2 family DNA or RNA helicase
MSKKQPKRRGTSLKPYKHQVESIDVFSRVPCGFDASDPGTGKTRVQIDVFAARRAAGESKALIIAPKSLLYAAWFEDFQKFAPHLKVQVVTAANREKALATEADVYVTNIDAVRWLVKKPPSFFKQFSTVIVDEVSAFKHHTSQRSRAAFKIMKHFKYRYVLSGTPNSNTITDIWHPYKLLDGGKRLGSSFYQFRAATCTPVQVGPNPNMIKWEDKPGAENAVAAMIADITVRHRFEDCISIPPNHQYPYFYQMPPAQAKAYLHMEKMALTQLSDGSILSAQNAAVVATKLLQIASGAAYKEGDDHDYASITDERYQLVADLVEAREQCVVFFHWQHQRDMLLKELQARGIATAVIDGSKNDNDRREAVDFFQKGFYRVILAHPRSAAHGLTLTRGTTTIWASPTYDLELFMQGNKRIYRAGQTKKTETIIVVAKGTIEEHVMERLEAKGERQGNMLDMLQSFFITR